MTQVKISRPRPHYLNLIGHWNPLMRRIGWAQECPEDSRFYRLRGGYMRPQAGMVCMSARRFGRVTRPVMCYEQRWGKP